MQNPNIQPTEIIDIDWDFYDYVLTLEKEWYRSRSNFTSKELLTIFPESIAIVPQKIKEWRKERALLVKRIRKKLILIRANAPNENARIFWREWLMITDGEKLLGMTAHIRRLKGFLMVVQGRT